LARVFFKLFMASHGIRKDSGAPAEPLSSISPSSSTFCEVAAASISPVLLTGRTGSGKSFLAREIHDRSPRADGPFIVLNCAALPEHLCERELFGHVRGAYTDAREGSPGVFEAASGGTLLLDEIGEMPVQLQGNLLEVLESGRVRRLGTASVQRVDVRVISATNRKLPVMIERGQFREDLFYRLAVLRHESAPLVGRQKEIVRLAYFFLTKHCNRASTLRLGEAAEDALMNHRWPGNIRELENAIRHGIAYAGGGVIEVEHLPGEILAGNNCEVVSSAARRYTAPHEPQQERKAIQEALAETEGNRTHAAKLLGMSRSALWMKMRFHQLL
jgi:transcriptional regulator with PAS, ATPase and Fis domain